MEFAEETRKFVLKTEQKKLNAEYEEKTIKFVKKRTNYAYSFFGLFILLDAHLAIQTHDILMRKPVAAKLLDIYSQQSLYHIHVIETKETQDTSEQNQRNLTEINRIRFNFVQHYLGRL